MIKKIAIILTIVVIALVGFLTLTLSKLDGIVKSTIEQVGSDALGSSDKVGSVDIDLKEGRATIKNLKIKNPEGFSNESAISFGEMTAVVDYKNLSIKKIYADGPEILVEQKGIDSNFTTFKKNLKSSPEEVQEDKDSDTEKKQEAAVYQIDLFQIKNIKLKLISDQLKEPQEVQLKNIVLKELKGTPSSIIKQILNQLVGNTITAVGKKGLIKALDSKGSGKLKSLFPGKDKK